MDIQIYIDQKKEFYKILIKFLDQSDDNDVQDLFDLFDSQKILENRSELKELLYLLSKITKNHHRNKRFFIKIEQILLFCRDKIKQTFSNDEIFKIFKTNKNILLILFKNEIIAINDHIIQYLKRKNYNRYFSPEIQNYDKNSVSDLDSETLTNFEEKRQLGENDSYICQLIRDDSVEDFVAYTTRINLSLSKTIIKQSIFETNSFLMKNKEISLIEYAAFFGSIQIFQYLNLNNVELNKQLWLYSIHSNNADLIHLIEETDISPPNNLFEEAIKCHHNEIANYIQNVYVLNETDFSDFKKNILAYCFHFHNYEFFPSEFENKFINFYLCQYDYINLVHLLLKNKRIDINESIVKYLFVFSEI